MEFTKYPKISERQTEAKHIKGQWIATEKVHGSNLSLYFDGTTIRAAKRNGFITDPSTFFNYQPWLTANQGRIRSLYEHLGRPFIIYGELFGGWYPPSTWTGATGSRISADGKMLVDQSQRAVQEGVYYTPDIGFIAFDLYTNGAFVQYREALRLFNIVGLMAVEPLVAGSLQAVLAFPKVFDSTIPARCGQAKLPAGSNHAEGLVIRPFDDPSHEVIYKAKNAAFREVSMTFTTKPVGEVDISDVLAYATKNRYDSAVSKIGWDATALLEEFVEDTMSSFVEDHPEAILKNYQELRAALVKAFHELHDST